MPSLNEHAAAQVKTAVLKQILAQVGICVPNSLVARIGVFEICGVVVGGSKRHTCVCRFDS